MQTKTEFTTAASREKARSRGFLKMYLWSASVVLATAGLFKGAPLFGSWMEPLYILCLIATIPLLLMSVLNVVLDERANAQHAADKDEE